ncbi:MAG: response regulator transcription factor [Deltaproteobacteria bacterium]|nr:response regulator transcription factor [Deltaproteobacteria bacterium]
MIKLLLVEDDKSLGQAIKEFLEERDYRIDWIQDPDDLPLHEKLKTYDLLLVDWILGNKEGLEIVKSIKKKGIKVPVIMITVKSSLEDKLKGFAAGVDDYITKPFFPEELLARIKAVLGRYCQIKEEIKIGNLTIDSEKKVVYLSGKRIELTLKEFLLLEVLARKRGKILSYDFLIDYVWEEGGSYETLKSHIYNIRKKIGKEIIKSIKGFGYKID